MHSLIQISFLYIGMSIHVNDSNFFTRHGRNAAYGGKTNRMISPQNNGHGPRGRNMGDRIRNLIETLFNVCRYRKDIPDIAQGLMTIVRQKNTNVK